MRSELTIDISKRKEKARMIAEAIGEKVKYLGPPSFAYQIGPVILDREGHIEHPDDFDDQLIAAALADEGTPSEEKPEKPAEEPTELIIELPRDGFTEEDLANLQKIVDSKNNLIRKALGAYDLSIIVSNDKVSFPWFKNVQGEEARVYTDFISRLCDMAKNQKRITAKEREVESEKYAFRCFLLRLGLSGSEYKNERKILLKNLSGSAAFPTKAAADEFARKQKEKQRSS